MQWTISWAYYSTQISINLMSKHKLPISGIVVQLGTEATLGSAFFLCNIMTAFNIKFEMHCTKHAHDSRCRNAFSLRRLSSSSAALKWTQVLENQNCHFVHDLKGWIKGQRDEEMLEPVHEARWVGEVRRSNEWDSDRRVLSIERFTETKKFKRSGMLL